MSKKKYTSYLGSDVVRVSNPFWRERMEVARDKVIPYQWEALNDRIEDAMPSYAIENFKHAAAITKRGDKKGSLSGEVFKGYVFQDSDLYKWIEAVGLTLLWHQDEKLEALVDGVIDLICSAQQEDGYLNTYYIINGLDKRWTNLRENHELYCLGHMIEAAAAYYHSTKKDKLLNACIKYINHVREIFGSEEGKLKGYPGHEVIEMALVRLYEITKDKAHIELAKYFIDERGQQPIYFDEENKKNGQEFWWKDTHFKYGYYQAHKPIREQDVAIGHAVRAVYLYSGMADVAKYLEDDSLYEACVRLWDNTTQKQMYITGNIGSQSIGESFSYDYDLPNDTIYGETCATIGLIFFAKRMLSMDANSKYADVMERALYNGSISGISLDGTKFFYVNPLEVTPERIVKNETCRHVKGERQKWFGCACCPPNIARLMTSIGSYIYTENEATIWNHLYIGSEFEKLVGDRKVSVKVETNYPWDEDITITFGMEEPTNLTYALRIPGWCNDYSLMVNGDEIEHSVKDGYIYLNREWINGDTIKLHLSMPVRMMKANPKVREDIGKIAVMRGPLVYCLEEVDNGMELHKIRVHSNMDFKVFFDKDTLGGCVLLQSKGEKLIENECYDSQLYVADIEDKYEETTLTWIPYYSWANRTPGEMMVWVRCR